MSKPSVFDVANYFRLQLSKSEGSSLTHLKLQKLVYYAQAWSLVCLERPLFDGDFEAWAHGPVNRPLYNQYKSYGWTSIAPLDEDQLFQTPEDVFEPDEIELLDEVWEIYGDYDAKYLERLTHQERPWIEARGGCAPGQYCDTVISEETMTEFYTKLLEEAQ